MQFRRQLLLEGLDIRSLRGAEIGPLSRPIVTKDDGCILYVDYTTADELRGIYAQDPDVNINEIVEIDAVWGNSSLSECLGGRRVDYVIASHVAEHVPDLITWLSEIGDVLLPGGQLRIVLPDKRFSFDVLRAETNLSDLVSAHLERARRPRPRDVFDFRFNYASQVDVEAVLNGSIDFEHIERFHTARVALEATQAVLDHPEAYFDVHVLVTSPKTFALLMAEVAMLGLLRLECAGFIDTAPANNFEFHVTLTPNDDRSAVTQSWMKMADKAADPLPGSTALPVNLVTLRETVDQMRRSLAQSEASLTQALAQRDEARARCEAIERSSSWLITAPLRRLARFATAKRR